MEQSSGSSLSAYLKPLLQLRVAGQTATLLNALMDAYERLPPAERVYTGGAAAALQTAQLAALVAHLTSTVESLNTVADAVWKSAPSNARRTDSAALERLASQLLEQLTDIEVAQALARLCSFLQREVFPTAAGTRNTSGVAAGGAAFILHATADAGMALLHACYRQPSRLLVTLWTSLVTPPGGAGAASPQRIAQHRFVATLTKSRLLGALCGATLAAPPPTRRCNRTPIAADDGGDYNAELGGMLLQLPAFLQSFLQLVQGLGQSAPLLAPLDDLQVRQFQYECLRQVAAVADRSSGTGAGGAAAAAAVQPPLRYTWPLLEAAEPLSGTSTSACPAMDKYTRAFNMRMCVAPTATVIQMLSEHGGMENAIRAAKELLPSRRAAAALGAGAMRGLLGCLEVYQPAWAADSTVQASAAACDTSPPLFVQDAGRLVKLVFFRMRGAEPAEAQECLPDLLDMVVCFIAMGAVAAGTTVAGATSLDPALPWHMALALSGLLQGTAARTPPTDPIQVINCLPPYYAADAWRALPPATRTVCLQRLGPTDLPRALDVLLRFTVARGCWDEQQHYIQPRWEQGAEPAMILSAATAELVTQLVRDSLRAGRRRLPEGGIAGGTGNAAGGGSPPLPELNAARHVQRAVQGDELGVVITALKLMRREVARRESSGRSNSRDPGSDDARRGLANFVSELGLSDRGLPLLLSELLQAARRAAAADVGGGGQGEPVVDVAALVVAQAVAACGVTVLPYMHQLVTEAIAEIPSGGLYTGDGGRAMPSPVEVGVFHLAGQGRAAAAAVKAAAIHLPPEVLLAAAPLPQRLLVALGQLFSRLRQEASRGRWTAKTTTLVAAAVTAGASDVADTVVLLSADERLREGCVPGWLWVEAAAPGASTVMVGLDEAALSVLYGDGAGSEGCSPSVPRPRHPIVTVQLGHDLLGSLGFDLCWNWDAEHGRRGAEVVRLAAVLLQQPGKRALTEGSTWRLLRAAAAGGPAAGAEGATAAGTDPNAGGKWAAKMWPPRLLRYCANPLCGDFSGGSEAGLPLQMCGRCKAVRYCCADCQRQHWPRHKADCKRWAAERSG